jgi:hypothetical protein
MSFSFKKIHYYHIPADKSKIPEKNYDYQEIGKWKPDPFIVEGFFSWWTGQNTPSLFSSGVNSITPELAGE